MAANNLGMAVQHLVNSIGLASVNWKRIAWITIFVWVVFNQGIFEIPEF